MANMSLKKVEIPQQEPNVRNKNFDEVTLGYTPEMAIEEASRCLNCKNPMCVGGCPVNLNIPAFIKCVSEGNFKQAYDIIYKSSSLSAVCGRVCPQESQCEAKCVRGIKGEPVAIGRLERFVSDWAMQNDVSSPICPVKNGHKVAVIGSGPSGLTCAGDLAKMGYAVTVFEAFHKAGGVLVYGIPEFRLPKSIVQKEVDKLTKIGVEIKTDMVIGKILSIDELIDMGYEAIFIGTGAGLPNFMGIEGEDLVGVYSANEYLTRINLMKAYLDEYDTPIRHSKSVAIVGGGNVAMDAARCAKRLGAENVYIIYRRSQEEMPARREEVEHAKEEGIIFKVLTNPVKILSDNDGQVCAIECEQMQLGEPDSTGRRRPVKIPDSKFVLNVDTVIISIGTSPNPLIRKTTKNLDVNPRGCFIVDENMATTREGVWAGGDAVTGAATVILAMGAGKKAATSIDEYLKNK